MGDRFDSWGVRVVVQRPHQVGRLHWLAHSFFRNAALFRHTFCGIESFDSAFRGIGGLTCGIGVPNA